MAPDLGASFLSVTVMSGNDVTGLYITTGLHF